MLCGFEPNATHMYESKFLLETVSSFSPRSSVRPPKLYDRFEIQVS